MGSAAIAKISPRETAEARTTPQLVRKNAGAVQIWNTITVLQRKTFAALLVNSYEELPNLAIHSHRIPIGVLAHLAGFKSNNTQYFKDALTGLVTTPLQWNIQRTDGREAWAVSATLASARIEDGVVHYAFSPELRARLYNPEVYAQLDMSIIRQFKSGYALALYENCMLFVDTGTTPDFSPQALRGLLGAGDNPLYENFGRLMDKVIKPACNEVNRLSQLGIEPVLRREARRVTSVRFAIQDKPAGDGKQVSQNPLLGRDSELVQRLQSEMCLVYGQVIKLFEEYSEQHLRAVLEYVKSRYLAGKVQKGKVAPYFLKTLKHAAVETLTPQSSLDLIQQSPQLSDEERQQSETEAVAERQRKEQLLLVKSATQSAFDALSADEQANLRESFLKHLSETNYIVYSNLRKSEDPFGRGPGNMLFLQHLIETNALG